MLVVMATFVFGCDSLLFSNSLFSKSKPQYEETSIEMRSEDHLCDQDSQFIEIKTKSDHSIFSKFFDIVTTPVSIVFIYYILGLHSFLFGYYFITVYFYCYYFLG